MRLTIRAAVAVDVARVQAIAAANPTAPQWSVEQFAEILLPNESAVTRVLLVGLQNDAVAGFVVVSALTAVYPVEAELESIAVAPEWQRQGVGRALLETAVGWADSVGAADLRLEVRTGNNSARNLYERTGFDVEGIRRGYYANPVEDAVCMSRKLRPTEM
ncbi:MAG TPA: ribosomal protein S18-alanine N-acetyltransferase [Terriglobus sp.]